MVPELVIVPPAAPVVEMPVTPLIDPSLVKAPPLPSLAPIPDVPVAVIAPALVKLAPLPRLKPMPDAPVAVIVPRLLTLPAEARSTPVVTPMIVLPALLVRLPPATSTPLAPPPIDPLLVRLPPDFTVSAPVSALFTVSAPSIVPVPMLPLPFSAHNAPVCTASEVKLEKLLLAVPEP